MDNTKENLIYVLTSKEVANKLNKNKLNELISSYNFETTKYEEYKTSKKINCFERLNDAAFVYRYLKEKGNKRISIIYLQYTYHGQIKKEYKKTEINNKTINYIILQDINLIKYKVIEEHNLPNPLDSKKSSERRNINSNQQQASLSNQGINNTQSQKNTKENKNSNSNQQQASLSNQGVNNTQSQKNTKENKNSNSQQQASLSNQNININRGQTVASFNKITDLKVYIPNWLYLLIGLIVGWLLHWAYHREKCSPSEVMTIAVIVIIVVIVVIVGFTKPRKK